MAWRTGGMRWRVSTMIIPVEETRQHALNRYLWQHRRYMQAAGIISAGLLISGYLMRWRMITSEFSAVLLILILLSIYVDYISRVMEKKN